MAGTIRQIAELAGVSRGTVDRVLNGRGKVKPEVAQRVENIAAKLDYHRKHPNRPPAGTAGPNARHWRLGAVIFSSQTPFMAQVRQGIADIREQLEQQGFEIILKECGATEEAEQLRLLDELDQIGIDGLAIMPVDCEGVCRRVRHFSSERGIPVITFCLDVVGAGRSCFVGLDSRKSGRTAAGLLGGLTGGNGQLLGITSRFAGRSCNYCMDSFMEEVMISFPSLELVGIQDSFDSALEVEQIVIREITKHPDLKGIFLISGGASGVKSAFEKLSLAKRPHVVFYGSTLEGTVLLQNGVIDFLIDSDGYRQGQQALSLLAEQLQQGRLPNQEYFYTETRIKTRESL